MMLYAIGISLTHSVASNARNSDQRVPETTRKHGHPAKKATMVETVDRRMVVEMGTPGGSGGIVSVMLLAKKELYGVGQ